MSNGEAHQGVRIGGRELVPHPIEEGYYDSGNGQMVSLEFSFEGLRTLASLDRRFTYHAPKPGQPERYETLRAKAKELARLMVAECPPGRELSTALTNLETSVFFANAAIARGE